jgi:hypothetical protein
MMSAIGPLNRLVATIATQLAQTGAPADAAAGRRKVRAGANAATPRRDLATLIALRVNDIDRDDPQRGRKAFRVFLEAVLLSQFGEQMINDPQFHQLVVGVHDALEADPQTNAMVQDAIAALLPPPTQR